MKVAMVGGAWSFQVSLSHDALLPQAWHFDYLTCTTRLCIFLHPSQPATDDRLLSRAECENVPQDRQLRICRHSGCFPRHASRSDANTPVLSISIVREPYVSTCVTAAWVVPV